MCEANADLPVVVDSELDVEKGEHVQIEYTNECS